MSAAAPATLAPTPDGFALAGVLTIATAAQVVEAAREAWPASGAPVVDFTGVTEADSAVLALIFRWQREAREQGGAIRCVNIPANVVALARLYGVDDLIAP